MAKPSIPDSDPPLARNDFSQPVPTRAAPDRLPATAFLVTCEHGGDRIPATYRQIFANAGATLASHRGHDAGALQLARRLAITLGAPLIASTVSRLLIDLNRSTHHRQLYSEWTRQLPMPARQEIAMRYYHPYRTRAEAWIAHAVMHHQQVIHLSCHSFTPVFDGVVREADIGLLYDPASFAEAALCRQWQARLASREAALRVRRNYPYRGTADGFVTYLRHRYSHANYLGIEIEVNQRHILQSPRHWRRLQDSLVATFIQAAPAVVPVAGQSDRR